MTLDEVRRNSGSDLHSKGQWVGCVGSVDTRRGWNHPMLRYCCLGMTDD